MGFHLTCWRTQEKTNTIITSAVVSDHLFEWLCIYCVLWSSLLHKAPGEMVCVCVCVCCKISMFYPSTRHYWPASAETLTWWNTLL